MTDAWWRVVVTVDAALGDAIAGAIVVATGNGVEELSSGTYCTTLPSEAEAAALRDELTAVFAGAHVEIQPVEAVDWTTRWRDGIVTRTFGRLIVTPSWLAASPQAGQVVVTIDPESAFGSGEHGSTRGALALLERRLRPGDRVIDLGSGSGILSIAAAALGARAATGIEIDEASNPIADANAARNGVADRVRFLAGDAADLARLVAPAEVVCSNILRSVNTLLLPLIREILVPGGAAIFAGMEEPEEPLFRPVLTEHGFEIVDEQRDAGWWSVAAHPR